MNRIFSWLQNTILLQIVIVCLASFAFFGIQAVNSGNTILLAEVQTQETVRTPEGIYYKGTPDNRDIRNENRVDSSQNRLKSQTQETVRTSEENYYKKTPENRATINDNQVDNAQKRLRDTAGNIRDRLNLNEETPESTKEFLDSAKTKVKEAVEPITGTKRGYYEENSPVTGAKDRR
ncbi:hypothetical protein Cylst_2432 [Cylindrospermum stagnale PCC 7417]|uniref:Uncharacterized protein n=1 Tax=Cylindrospermum stagnale PCC 7417 TaxID=56107 RepID=K9WWA0_9NOST|nr:hypothetical protein [Cylindrospermum stagnale]AFZ24650.1 hypothetical protein Cylst_2432 [Cylindrospermum stagnale PCC 7417]